jgi:predicted RNase H-like HicB family nuclease
MSIGLSCRLRKWEAALARAALRGLVQAIGYSRGAAGRYNGSEETTMGSEIIFEVEESPEGGYDARALGYSIYTQAETIDELKAMLQDAVRCHFEENERPRVIRLHLVKDEVIAV